MRAKPDISPQRYYTQAEAARLLDCDRHTLRRKEKDPRVRLEPHTIAGDSRSKYYLGRQLLALAAVQ